MLIFVALLCTFLQLANCQHELELFLDRIANYGCNSIGDYFFPGFSKYTNGLCSSASIQTGYAIGFGTYEYLRSTRRTFSELFFGAKNVHEAL